MACPVPIMSQLQVGKCADAGCLAGAEISAIFSETRQNRGSSASNVKFGRSVSQQGPSRGSSGDRLYQNASDKLAYDGVGDALRFSSSAATTGRSVQRSRHRAISPSTAAGPSFMCNGEPLCEAGPVDPANQEMFVSWFRKAWPYIQGHRSSVFVIVLPGDVIADSSKINGVLQDILLLHGLGIKLVIIPGSQLQIDQLLMERGRTPCYEGAYRVTDQEALAGAMEAAGSIRVALEAKLSRGPSIPILRRHRDNSRWHEVSVASGNFLAAKRRGVVDGVDFGATGEVKRVDIFRIRERLDNDCIVMLSNLGYSSTGEVLNCNTYEVATACAIELQADKLLVMLDGPVVDENGRKLRFMSLKDADKLIHKRASQSYAAADYVKAVAGLAYVQSLGIPASKTAANGVSAPVNGVSAPVNGNSQNGAVVGWKSHGEDGSTTSPAVHQKTNGAGFAIGGEERRSRTTGFLSELTAAVYVCRNGVGRVQLLDSNIQGALLLELYSRDGMGTMVSSDSYEGTRTATPADICSIIKLLQPLEESGILVNRPRKQLEREVDKYMVVERDGDVVACAALFPYLHEKCGEVAAFAVSRECQGIGLGNTFLGYVEKKAEELRLERLFLLTTRTADWFVQRGFVECGVDCIPKKRQETINFARGSKYYTKTLNARFASSHLSVN